MFGDVGLAVDGALAAGHPARAGDQPDLELGARAAVADAAKPLGERARARLELVEALLQAAAGSGSSSRITCATACHRRSTSGSPRVSRAQRSVG